MAGNAAAPAARYKNRLRGNCMTFLLYQRALVALRMDRGSADRQRLTLCPPSSPNYRHPACILTTQESLGNRMDGRYGCRTARHPVPLPVTSGVDVVSSAS